MINIGNDWDNIVGEEYYKDYYQNLRAFLVSEYRSRTIYPDMNDIFNALKYTPFSDVKVVILGQDPYHGEGQAHGLCFSVKPGVPSPPSLINIFKELKTTPPDGNLTRWATQGVFLLNTVLTVREHEPNSHKGKGWEMFTDKIIAALNDRDKPVVFMLWGNNAKSKQALITNKRHLILAAAHPSPLSANAGFFGCGHFEKANEFLKETGTIPINW